MNFCRPCSMIAHGPVDIGAGWCMVCHQMAYALQVRRAEERLAIKIVEVLEVIPPEDDDVAYRLLSQVFHE